MLRLLILFNSNRPRGRLALSVAGIALGVALGYAVHLVNRAAVEDVAAAVRSVAGEVDIATAQWRFGRLGELNRLDVRLAPGRDRGAMVRQIQALLPPGVHAAALESLEQASAYPSRAYRVNLNVLAMVALFTGGFLVFSAQALETARRRGEHALLRVLGLQQRGVARLVLIEAAALGVVGAALGLALGYALAFLAVRTWGADLGAGMFRGVSAHLAFSVPGALFYFAGGIAVAVLGALLPARDAARTPPARALKAGDELAMLSRAAPAAPGIALLACGVLLAQLGPVRGLPLFGYAAIACLLVGSVALMPRVSRAVFELLPLPRSPGLALALAHLRAAPGPAAVSLAAIVARFSLLSAMAIMVASFRESVDDWPGTVLPAEVYLRTTPAGGTGGLEPGVVAPVRSLPGIARV